MIEERSPADIVIALVDVLNGDAPREAARDLLDPTVKIHTDSGDYRGIDTWFRWVHLIRNHGRVSDLRLTDCEVRCDDTEPSLVHLSARWSGTIRSGGSRAVSTREAKASYLVGNGRITAMWTSRANYEFIFPWIRYPLLRPILVGLAAAYFWGLALRNKDFRLDTRPRTTVG